MNRIKSLLCLIALGALVLAGCVIEAKGTFFFSGSDFGVNANWKVNGQTPDASVCGAAGIETVRVVFWDAGTAVDVADLTAPCSAGSFATAEIFAYGDYETQWQALDKDGNVLGIMTDRFTLIINSGNHSPGLNVGLAPIDFISTSTVVDSLSLSLGWQTPDLATPNADCATAGVTMMEYTLTRPDGTTDSMMDIACGAGIDYAETPQGAYNLLITGSDVGGNKYWTNTCAFTVAAGANTVTCDSPYTGPAPEPSIAMAFTFGGMNCAGADITEFSYTVLDSAGATMVAGTQSQVAGACTDDTLLFDMGLTDATDYVINVDATTSGFLKYGANCSVTASLSPVALVCDAIMMD